MEFGNLHQIEIREIWANEANKLTPWLAENIQLLGDEQGLELELREREASVGDFSCETKNQNLVTYK